MSRAFSVGDKLLLSHLAAVFTVALSTGVFLYFQATESVMAGLRARLMSSAALASVAIDPADVAQVAEHELEAPAYERLLATLRRLARANPDIAFLYVMRREGDKVIFVADSDEGPMQAKPGVRYRGDVSSLVQGFAAPHADHDLVGDEWGVFLSGYAPIGTGGHYLVGIDMNADECASKFKRLRLAALSSFLVGGILSMLLARWLARRLIAKVEEHARHTARITAEQLRARG